MQKYLGNLRKSIRFMWIKTAQYKFATVGGLALILIALPVVLLNTSLPQAIFNHAASIPCDSPSVRGTFAPNPGTGPGTVHYVLTLLNTSYNCGDLSFALKRGNTDAAISIQSISANNVILGPGASKTVDVYVTNSSTAPGTYTFNVIATSPIGVDFPTQGTYVIPSASNCTHTSPVVTVNTPQSGAPGSAVTYTVIVTNRDNSSCGATEQFGLTTGAYTDGLDANSVTYSNNGQDQWPVIAPGGKSSPIKFTIKSLSTAAVNNDLKFRLAAERWDSSVNKYDEANAGWVDIIYHVAGNTTNTPTPTGTCATEKSQHCDAVWTADEKENPKDSFVAGTDVLQDCFSMGSTKMYEIRFKFNGQERSYGQEGGNPGNGFCWNPNDNTIDGTTVIPANIPTGKRTLELFADGTLVKSYDYTINGPDSGPTETPAPTDSGGNGGDQPTDTIAPTDSGGGGGTNPTDTIAPTDSGGGNGGNPTDTPALTSGGGGGNNPTNTQGEGPDTHIAFTLQLQSIGVGECKNSNNCKVNPNPQTKKRPVTVYVYSLDADPAVDDPIEQQVGTMTYNPATGYFVTNNFDLGTTLTKTGSYKVLVATNGFLRKSLGVPTITVGGTGKQNQLTSPTKPKVLFAGDINGDNAIDILDYSLLSSCFSTVTGGNGCDVQNSDFNDKVVPSNPSSADELWNEELSFLYLNFSKQFGD